MRIPESQEERAFREEMATRWASIKPQHSDRDPFANGDALQRAAGLPELRSEPKFKVGDVARVRGQHLELTVVRCNYGTPVSGYSYTVCWFNRAGDWCEQTFPEAVLEKEEP